MRTLAVTVAADRYDHGIKTGEPTWESLVKKFTSFTVTDETFEEYRASGNEKLAIKDTGWIVGGPFEPAKRRKANLKFRSILTLDLDHLEPWDVDTVLETYRGIAYVIHSSHSHSEDAPRLRLIVPLARDVSPEEYEPIGRKVASWFDMDAFDDTGFQVSRVMFWPSRSTDGVEFSKVNQGDWLDPDAVLDLYEDWRDWGEWPTSSREDIHRDPSAKAEDPYTKPGAIGAFNRLYSVPHAIEEFDLPYVSSGMGENRYSFAEGSSVDGAIFYEDDGHLYSWHESDPARGNHNAFDLVRIHKFGDYDGDTDDDSTPIGQRESQKQMLAYVLAMDAVTQELAAADGFEDLGEAAEAQALPGGTDPSDAGGQPGGGDGGEDDLSVAPGPGKDREKLTYDSIRKSIDERLEPIDDEFRRRLITKIAAAKLLPSEVSVLAALIKSGHLAPAPTKQAILDEIKVTHGQLAAHLATDGAIADIELELIRRVLLEHFDAGEHIRRYGKQFWTYEGGVWIRREDEWIRAKVQDTFIGLRTDRPKEALQLVAAIGEVTTSSAAAKLWAMFCSHVAGVHDDLDPMHLLESARPVLNCLNGEVHFKKDGTWKLTKHHPELFLTAQIPLVFEPEADTSDWDSFCDILFHDSIEPDEMKRHLEEVGGYVLQPWRMIATFLLMRGAPLAGKSTFGNILTRMMGRSAVNREFSRYKGSNDHDTAGLVGKLLLLDADFSKGDLLPDGFIKRISEEVQITANPKGKDEFEFLCRSVPMVITNGWPACRDHSGALERRLLAWDLPAIPPGLQDDRARDRLLSDGLAGALLRFANGFARLYARYHSVEGQRKWSIPDECVDAARAWSRNSDVVSVWSHECITPAAGKWLQRSDLFGWFVHWYRENNPGGRPPGKREFLERIQGILGPATKSEGIFGWRGQEYTMSEFDEG